MVAIVGMASVGCKKEPVPIPEVDTCCDTIFLGDAILETVLPSQYLMTYPGSWWLYSDGTRDTSFYWDEASIFQKEEIGDTVIIHEERFIGPYNRIHGRSGVLHFEKLVTTDSTSYETSVYRYLKTEVGVFYYSYRSFDYDEHTQGYTSDRREVIAIHDSLELNGVTYIDVIHVKEGNAFWWDLNPGGGTTYHRYYSKGIGLVYSTAMGVDDNWDRALVDHFIAPH